MGTQSRRRIVGLLSAGTLLLATPGVGRAQLLGGLLGGASTCTSSSGCAIGTFSAPFAEPTIEGVSTSEKCITTATGSKVCKPAAGTLALLRDGRLIYFDALEGTENVNLSIVTDFGTVSVNDQTRVLALSAGDAPGRYLTAPGRPSLGSAGRLTGEREIALVDEWLGLAARLAWTPAAEVTWGPVETVSVSEAGFERIYQGLALLLLWPLGGEAREMEITLTVGTP